METYEQKIEIPFGAKDSELQEWTYTIPEGMEAEIKNGKVIIKRKESEDERIRKDLIKYLESDRDCQPCQDVSFYDSSIAWLEKHKDSVSNAKYIEDVAHAFEDGRKKGIEEKQKEQKPVEWSEEDKAIIGCIVCCLDGQFVTEAARKQCLEWFNKHRRDFLNQPKQEWSEEDEENLNMVLDMVKYCSVVPPEDIPSSTGHLHPTEKYKKELTDWLKSLRPQPHKEIYQAAKYDLAIKFMNYLDNNKPEGKMCLSNEECEDIDKAFKENDLAKIIRYAKKYQIQSEQKPEVKLTGWVARDRNGEIWVYGAYPEKNSEMQIWTESSCMPLNRKSFPDLKWEDEPMEVEITIRKK